MPVTIEPFEVEDGVPPEAEVEWVVTRLRNNRAGGGVKDAGGGLERVAGGSKEGVKGEGDEDQGRRRKGGDSGRPAVPHNLKDAGGGLERVAGGSEEGGKGAGREDQGRRRQGGRKCGEEIAAGSLSGHLMTRHGRAVTRRHL